MTKQNNSNEKKAMGNENSQINVPDEKGNALFQITISEQTKELKFKKVVYEETSYEDKIERILNYVYRNESRRTYETIKSILSESNDDNHKDIFLEIAQAVVNGKIDINNATVGFIYEVAYDTRQSFWLL